MVLAFVLSLSAFATDKSHAERARNFSQLGHVMQKKIPADISHLDRISLNAKANHPKMPLGMAIKRLGNGVGTAVDNTLQDYQWLCFGSNVDNTGEMIDLGFDSTSSAPSEFVDVHFMHQGLTVETLFTHATYQTYSLNDGTWKFNGALGCEDIQRYDSVGGIIGDLETSVDPPGLIVASTADRYGEYYPDTLLNHWGYYFQSAPYAQLDDGGVAGAHRGYVDSATFNPLRLPGADPTRFLDAPEIEISDLGGQQVIHCVGIVPDSVTQTTFPGCTALDIQNMVYFRNTSATPWDPSAWTNGQVVGTSYQFHNFAVTAERNGPKVATFMWKWTQYACDSFPASLGYDYFDGDLWYNESVDTGNTWAGPQNCTNHRRDIQSHSVGLLYCSWDATYDSDGNLHLVYAAAPTPAGVYGDRNWNWLYFDDDIMHWTPGQAPNKVASAVYSAVNSTDINTWQAYADCGPTGLAVSMAWQPSIAQCGDYLYCTWYQFHSKWNKLTSSSPVADSIAATTDCAAGNDEPFGGANAEILVSVSSDLSGAFWDAARNLTNTYTPGCEHPSQGGTICGNESMPNMGHQALDVSGLAFSPMWPSGNEVIPANDTGGYDFTSNSYLMVYYLDDVWPGIWWAGDTQLSSLNDTKWFRMACVEPEVAPIISVDPNFVRWPAYVETGGAESYTVTVTNDGNLNGNCTVTWSETSPTSGWMNITNTSFVVAPGGGQQTFDIDVTGPTGGPQYLNGVVTVASNDPARPTIDIQVHIWNADTIAEPNIYDTAATSTAWSKGLGDDVALTVANHGEMGNGGQGLVNLDFVQSGTDCDSSATVYLFSGSPFVMIKGTGGIDGTTSHYSSSVGSANPMTWVPLPDATIESGTGTCTGNSVSLEYDSVFTGKMANRDTTLWMTRTFYAPRNNTANPSFVICKTVVGTDSDINDSLMIGDIIDWDVPSNTDDISSATNVAGVTQPFEEQFAYLQGTDTAGDTSCISNARRFATDAFDVKYVNDTTTLSDVYWNSWVTPVRDTGDAAPTGIFDIDTVTNDYQYDLWWDSMLVNTGNVATGLNRDLGQFVTYDVLDGLAASDTLYYWTIMATGYDMADYTELNDNVADAKTFAANLRACSSGGGCCTGLRGNVDGIGGDAPTLGDLSALIDVLFISLTPPPCPAEANVDGIGPDTPAGITLGDLSALIDVLFISLNPPPPCP